MFEFQLHQLCHVDHFAVFAKQGLKQLWNDAVKEDQVTDFGLRCRRAAQFAKHLAKESLRCSHKVMFHFIQMCTLIGLHLCQVWLLTIPTAPTSTSRFDVLHQRHGGRKLGFAVPTFEHTLGTLQDVLQIAELICLAIRTRSSELGRFTCGHHLE